jgi:hypothetical protein
MGAQRFITLFAIGFNASVLIAAGERTASRSAEPAPTVNPNEAAQQGLGPSGAENRTPESSTPPSEGDTAGASEDTEVSQRTDESASDLPAVRLDPDENSAPLILPIDGEALDTVFPLPMSEADLVAMTATPFSEPNPDTAGTASTADTEDTEDVSGDNTLEPTESDGETPAPVDDRTGPWIAAPGGLTAQSAGNIGTGFSAAPSGFTLGNSGIPMGGVPIANGIFEGFSLIGTLSSTYTSNVTNSPGEPIAPIQDDFVFGLGGSINYLSKATEWTFGGSYAGQYNQYLEVTSYSGYNQELGLVANYDGSRLSASVTANVSYDQGNNRYYSSEFVQQTSYNFNLNTRYRISRKTSLQSNVSQSYYTTSENSFNDTESFNLGLAALWKYSKLTEFGPGIRYTILSGGNRDERTSIGPELLVNYKLASKVNLNSRVGVQFAEYESGGSADPLLAASIRLNYTASKLWNMNLGFYSGNQAGASSADAFTQVNSISLDYIRKVHQLRLRLGINYEINSYQTPANSSVSANPDLNYFSINSSLGMPVFSNTTFGSIFVQYSDQSGRASQTWDAVQSGISMSRSF